MSDVCVPGDSSVTTIELLPVDKVDILFVVDSSRSMLDEQQKLKEQIASLVETLARGVRADGTTFPAAKDMHLGVVTTDMGVPGANLPDSYNCGRNGGYGDDGELQTSPGLHYESMKADGTPYIWDPDADCEATYPKYISFELALGDDPASKAHDLGCLAQVGPGGCGYEFQLEAGLKALWPSDGVAPVTTGNWLDLLASITGSRITFLTTNADVGSAHQLGHGDGYNAGFLRDDIAEGISVLAILLVTDEDDCSSKTVNHLLADGDPSVAPEVWASGVPIPVNLRCVVPTLQKYLWDTERYVQGFQGLRPGNENLVVFGAIAGVPQNLVTRDLISTVDFSSTQSRKDFYNTIRSDPNMQLQLTPAGDGIRPSCTPANDPEGGARPARRILDVVEGFGENGVIQSICEDSYEGAIETIINKIGKRLATIPNPTGATSCN